MVSPLRAHRRRYFPVTPAAGNVLECRHLVGVVSLAHFSEPDCPGSRPPERQGLGLTYLVAATGKAERSTLETLLTAWAG